MAPKESRAPRAESKSSDIELRILVANPRASAVRARVAAASAKLSAESENDAMNWIESVSILDASDETR